MITCISLTVDASMLQCALCDVCHCFKRKPGLSTMFREALICSLRLNAQKSLREDGEHIVEVVGSQIVNRIEAPTRLDEDRRPHSTAGQLDGVRILLHLVIGPESTTARHCRLSRACSHTSRQSPTFQVAVPIN